MAVERIEKYSGVEEKFWEVLSINSSGVIGESSWSDSIEAKESTIFKDDLDLSGSIGFNLTLLLDVATDTGSVTLKTKEEATTKKTQYFIEDSSNGIVEILYSWGQSADDYKEFNVEGNTTYQRDAVASAATTLNGEDVYLVAIKESTIYSEGEVQNVDLRWRLDYVDLNGTILEENSVETGSIQSYETTFEQDLDNDSQVGLNLSGLTAIGTDSKGVTLSRDGEAIYITDQNLPSKQTFLLQDYW